MMCLVSQALLAWLFLDKTQGIAIALTSSLSSCKKCDIL